MDAQSDFITILNIWRALHHGPERPRSTGELKKYCRGHYLSFRRVREWRDIHRQIADALKEQGFDESRTKGDPLKELVTGSRDRNEAFHPLYAAIHRCILSGFLSNIAMQKEKVFYRAAKDREAMLFPGSGLFKNPGNWIVAAEMVETSRLFARQAAVIDVAWLEPLGGDLCRKSWSDPHWEKNRGQVVAKEQVTLFGLPIVVDRQVVFGRIDPDRAADIFIRSALVEGDVKQPPAFLRHNLDLVEAVRGMEDRIRRRDILVDDEVLVDFYRQRLAGITDLRSLNHLVRKKGGDRFLRLDREMLIRYRPDDAVLDRFPRKLDLGHRVLSCDYVFDPGHAADGVTLTVPAEATGEVPRQQLDWVVPGLLEEKITALIKGLPKAHRVRLVPVAETVQLILDEMPRGEESLPTALSRFLFQRLKVDIPASAWPVDALADHLKLRLAITDAKGRVVASGRDEALLDREASDSALPGGMKALKRKWERENVAEWDFGDLPEVLHDDRHKEAGWRLYPRLAVENDGIALRLFTDAKEARQSHREERCGTARPSFRRRPEIFKKKFEAAGPAQTPDRLFRRAGRHRETALSVRLTGTVRQIHFYPSSIRDLPGRTGPGADSSMRPGPARGRHRRRGGAS